MKDKSIKILGILFLLIIPFHKLIEGFISNVFVLTIFNKINSSISNDIVAFILVILLLYSLVISLKREVYLANNYIFLLTGLLIIYAYYRFFGSVWSFVEFKTARKLVYFDLFLLFIATELLKKIFYKSRIRNIVPEKGFLFDNPLGQNDIDILQREDYAKSICKKIKNTENQKSAFSIGLNGDWGVGKTSFFNLIKRNLNESDYIIFDFNPWLNNGATSIINEFFKLLSLEVNMYNSNLSKKIELYGKLLLKFGDSNLNKAVNPILHLNSLNNIAQTQYSEINSSISKLNKTLIIFIDDLDRLDNNEIIEVIRIIRNTANFANTVFIAAYDRNYLINALKKINSHNSEFFLEKIFQVEVHLPEYEIKTIKKRVYDLIKNNLTSEDKKKLRSLFFDKNHSFSFNLSHNYSDNMISTIRDATRFANSFNLSYLHLMGEVNIKDLYYLELLKLKYPGVYNLILQERDNFLTLDDVNSSGFSYRNYSFYSLKKCKDKISVQNSKGQEVEFIIESYLKENTPLIGTHKKSIPSIIEILKLLFPEKTHSYNGGLEPLSLADPKCFDRYSYYRLLAENLSEVDFNKYLNKNPDEFKNKMKYWVSTGLRSEIADKFRWLKDYNSRDVFEKTIQGIYNFARIPVDINVENDYSGYDSFDFRIKIDNSKNIISDTFYNGDVEKYSQFLKGIFQEASYPYLKEAQIIFDLFKSINEDFILSPDYFDDLRLNFFRIYLESKPKIDIKVFHLYHYCDLNNVITLAGSPSTRSISRNANPKANKLLLDFLKEKDLDGFLYWMYDSEPFNKERYSLVANNVYKMFGGYTEFKEFLDQFDEQDYEYLSEFKKFFEACERVDFKDFIEFKFTDIPLRS